MADIEHLGIGINTKVDYNSLTRANEETKKFISNLGVLENKFERLKAPSGLSNGFDKVKSSVNSTARSVDELKNCYNGFSTAGETAAKKVNNVTNRNIISLNKYRESLNHLGSTSSNTAGKIKHHLQETNASTSKLIDANAKLRSSIIGVGNSSRAMNGLSPTIWKAGNSAKEASGGFNTAKNSVDNTSKALKNNRTASDKATTGFTKLHDAGSKLVSIGAGISAAMVPVAAAFKKANDEATKLADEYNIIKNLQETSGDSAKTARRNTAAIKKENRELSLKYGVDQQSLAEGSEELLRRGYSGKQDLAAHKYFVQAAKATKEDYNPVVNAATEILDQYGYKKKAGNSTKKMARYTKEVLNKAAYVGDVTSGQVGGEGGFGNSFKESGALLHSTGQSLSSALAAFGTLSNSGVVGTEAGTGLKQVVSSLLGASKSKTKTAALNDLGLTAGDFFNANGKMKQLPEIFQILHNATRGKKNNRFQSDFKQIFGQTGFNDATILANNTRDLANNVKTANRANSTDYITKLSAKNMESLQNQIAKTKQLFKDVGIQFAQQIAPGLANMLKVVNKVLRAMEGWPQPVKKTLGYITAITGAISTGVVAKKLVGNLLGVGGKAVAKGTAKTASKSPGFGGIFGKAGSNLIGGKFAKSRLGQKVAGKFGGTASKSTTVLAGVGIAATSGFDLYKAITAKNSTAKFKNYGKSIGSAIGGGIGLWLGGPAGAAVGTTLGQVAGGWAGKMAQKFSKTKFGKAIGHTFNQAVWSIKQDLRPLGKEVHKSLGTVGKEFNSLNRTVGKAWRDLNRNKDFRAFKRNLSNFFKSSIVAVARFGIKEVTTILRAGIKTAIGVIKGLTKMFKGIVGVVKNTVKLVSDVFHGRWGKVWNDAKGIVKSAVKLMTGWVDTLYSTVKGPIDAIVGTAKNVWNFVTGHDSKVSSHHENSTNYGVANYKVANMQNGQGAKHHAPKSPYGSEPSIASRNHVTQTLPIKRLPAHANGTASLVGEAGPELAYKPYANHARLLGARGPQLAKIQAGEKILNARDTAKVMNGGGLGKGLVLNGYANGTAKLDKTKKSVTNDYKNITDRSTKSLNKLTKANKSAFTKISGTAQKESNRTKKNTISDFTSITSKVNKQTDKTRKNTVSDYTDMRKGSLKQMDAMHKGVIDTATETAKGFGKAMGKMDNYAHSAMSNTVDQLNKGISSIDKVLDQFGGNSTVIKPIHFASGTDGELRHNTLAMVNDATSGPRQEAIVKRSGSIYLPRGNNRTLMLEAGDRVLNGYQTQDLAHYMGLTHFAKGSGVSTKALQKIADQASANPAQAFHEMFASKINPSGTDLQKGTVNFAKNGSTKYGNPWSNAMWTVIEDAIGGTSGKGGTREAFLKYAESTFSGVKYQLGAASRTLSDCSGMVMQALRHFGVNIGRTTVAMQESSGTQYLGKSLSKTLPGDLVIFGHGTGAAGHVGIIKNPRTGTMFNETEPRAHVSRIADDESMGYGFYRVRGLHNKTQKKQASASKSLMALAKRELGPHALSWIKNNLAEDDDFSGIAGKATGDHAHWMKQAHIPEKDWAGINYIVSHESTWNPKAVNPSSGTFGLGQMQGYNLHYYTRHGSKNNPIAQLMGIMDYIHDRYGTVAKAVAFRQAHNYYALGGDPAVNNRVLVGEHGPELAEFKSPVHIYSNEQTRQKLKPIKKSTGVRPVKYGLGGSHPVTVNINVNGSVPSDQALLRKFAQMIGDQVDQKLDIICEHIANDTGVDESYY